MAHITCLKTRGGAAITYGGNLLYIKLPPIPARTIRYQFLHPDIVTQPANDLSEWTPVLPGEGIWDYTPDTSLYSNPNDWSVSVALGYREHGRFPIPGTNPIQYIYKYGVEAELVRRYGYSNCIPLGFPSFNYNSPYAYNIIDIDATGVTDTTHLFYECILLNAVTCEIPFKGTNTRGLFSGDYMLRSVAPFDTNGATTMWNMFSHCMNLRVVPMLNTSSVTTMESMFSHCHLLESVPLYDTSNVTNMSRMFASCKSLVEIPDLTVTKVTSMGYFAYEDNSVRVGAERIYNKAVNKPIRVTSYSTAFYGCGNSSNIPDTWKQVDVDYDRNYPWPRPQEIIYT